MNTSGGGTNATAAMSAKEVVLAAIDVIHSNNAARALDYYHDDVDFIGYAPVELFPHMGARHGKAEAMRTVTALHQQFSRMRHEIEFIAAEGDAVAVILRLHLQKQENDRIIQLQVANVGIPHELAQLAPYVLTLLVLIIAGGKRGRPPRSLGRI